jgi:hypothetical protein
MRIRTSCFVAVAFSATVSLLPAGAAAQARVHGLARLGLEYGGDRVIEFEYEDGSTPDMTAGGGLLLTIGGGAQVATFGTHALDAQLSAGLKWRTIPAATNQDANWLRMPVEGILFYRMPSGFRVGAGGVVHLANTLKASGAVLNDRVQFTNTPGFLLQAEYIRRNIAFDLRYTFLEYETDRAGSDSIDASSIGAGLSVFFGRSRPNADGAGSGTQR